MVPAQQGQTLWFSSRARNDLYVGILALPLARKHMYGEWGAEGAAPWVPQPDPTATALGRSLGSSSSSMPAAAVQCLQLQAQTAANNTSITSSFSSTFTSRDRIYQIVHFFLALLLFPCFSAHCPSFPSLCPFFLFVTDWLQSNPRSKSSRTTNKECISVR